MNRTTRSPAALHVRHLHVRYLRFAGALLLAALLAACGRAPQGEAVLTAQNTIRVPPGPFGVVADGRCSLTEAILAANTDSRVDACASGAGADLIVLEPGLYAADTHAATGRGGGRIVLPPITSEIILQGNGARIERDPSVARHPARLMQVAAEGVLQASDLTFRGGDVQEVDPSDQGRYHEYGGGALLNLGTATLRGVVFDENGSAVDNRGHLSVSDCAFTRNRAAVSNEGTLSVRNCEFMSNRRAAIRNYHDAKLTRVLITENLGSIVIEHDGFRNGGVLQLIDSTITQNESDGNGFFNFNVVLNYGGNAILRQVTISENGRESSGAGNVNAIFNYEGHLDVSHSTLVNNVNPEGNGIGIYESDDYEHESTTISHTILAGHSENCTEPVSVSDGYNLEDRYDCGLGHPTDASGVDPRLWPLADNGGPHPTHMPGHFSPVLDAGDPAFWGAIRNDQRGSPFARVVLGRIDIGAIEAPFDVWRPFVTCSEGWHWELCVDWPLPEDELAPPEVCVELAGGLACTMDVLFDVEPEAGDAPLFEAGFELNPEELPDGSVLRAAVPLDRPELREAEELRFTLRSAEGETLVEAEPVEREVAGTALPRLELAFEAGGLEPGPYALVLEGALHYEGETPLRTVLHLSTEVD